MRTGFCRSAMSACLLAAVLAPAARAQYARTLENLVSRPSTRGPSATVGGRFTSSSSSLQMTHRGVSTLGTQQFEFRSRADGKGQYIPMSWTGITNPRSLRTSNTFFGQGSDATRISGLSAAQNLALPVPGIPIGYVPAINAYAYSPQADTSRFQKILGLVPAESSDSGPPIDLVADRMNARLAVQISAVEQHGLEAFKRGTVETRNVDGQFQECTDCTEQLAIAAQYFRQAGDLETTAARPLVLAAHTALDQERPMRAVNLLLRAYQRSSAEGPTAFFESFHSLDSYFGDVQEEGASSEVLRQQLLRFSKIRGLNPESAEAAALTAYCAWQLEEWWEAEQALASLETLANETSRQQDELLAFADGLRAVLGERHTDAVGAGSSTP